METFEWDMSDNINTQEEVYAYLEAALEENDTETLVYAYSVRNNLSVFYSVGW